MAFQIRAEGSMIYFDPCTVEMTTAIVESDAFERSEPLGIFLELQPAVWDPAALMRDDLREGLR